MKKMKSAFTMIELIFVIVIIGILAAVALPKFSGITDSAKINSELSSMDNLTGSLEWSKQSYVDIATPEWPGSTSDLNKDGDTADIEETDEVTRYDEDADAYAEKYTAGKLANLHFKDDIANEVAQTVAVRGPIYKQANREGSLFAQVSKNGGQGMTVVAFTNDDTITNGDDVLILTGKSSHKTSGTETPTIEDAGATLDLVGKPDRNDFWIFNGKSKAVTVVAPTSKDTVGDGVADSDQTIVVPPYTIKLVDVDGPLDFDESTITIDGVTVSQAGL